MRILATGAAGSIGRTVVPGLAAGGHEVVGLDLVPPPDDIDVPWHRADCADGAAVDAVFAAARPEAVVHLAGRPEEQSLPDALVSHAHTTAALLDAMVAHGATRLVYASSNHAVGRAPRGDLLTLDQQPRPDTFYGVGKVAAEALMRLYADRHGPDAISCRIGSFLERPTSVRGLSTWLSPADCVRMVEAAISTPSPGFAVLYGISANTRGWWDLEPGRRLGYHPRDDAEEYAAEIEPSPDDEFEGSLVGGPFAGERFYRPAIGAD